MPAKSWHQFGNTSRGMLADALEEIDEICVRINAVQSTGHDQPLDNADVFGTQLGRR